MKTLIAVIGLFIMAEQTVFGFGDQGHKAIWTAAQTELSPEAKKRVKSILGKKNLPMTAIWLDKARSAKKGKGPLKGDHETADFNAKFDKNDEWHYVNLPVHSNSYDDGKDFTSDDDVVQRIKFCIRVLQNKDHSLSKRIALRTLIHLVGDIHQPLHCVTGYYDTSNVSKPVLHGDPASAKTFRNNNDRGGNQLFFKPFGRFDELHGFWDGDLVKAVADGSGSVTELANTIEEAMDDISVDDGDSLMSWPEKWANESLKAAQKAYDRIEFGKTTVKAHPHADSTAIEKIEITFLDGKATYTDQMKSIAKEQLVKASLRLANTLNAIFASGH